MRVCVIGAGSTGLATIAHLKSFGDGFEVVCFEKSDYIGGEWNYTDDNTYKDGERPNAMYKSLRLNTDKYSSNFPGFEFPVDVPTWPDREQVLQYYNDYADHLNLRDFIKLNTKVKHICPILEENPTNTPKWNVEWKSAHEDATKIDIFDSIVVCTGIFQTPVIPDGFTNFTGEKCHSCEYREPSSYTDKVVLLVGSGPSSWDIALEISSVAEKVFVSCVEPMAFDVLPSNIEYKELVNNYDEHSVTFTNEETTTIDAVVLCTGYLQSFPFLDTTCNIKVLPEGFVYPLFLNIVHPRLRTLFFNGMNYVDAHTPCVAFIAKFIANALLGKAKLPSSGEMLQTIDRDIDSCRSKGQSPRLLIKIGFNQPDWMIEIAKFGNIDSVPLYPTFDTSIRIIASHKFHILREYDYIPNGDGSYTIIKPTNQKPSHWK